MDCYLNSIDYDLQYIVTHGDMIPTKKVYDRLGEKTQEVFDEKDKIMISKNVTANNYLIC